MINEWAEAVSNPWHKRTGVESAADQTTDWWMTKPGGVAAVSDLRDLVDDLNATICQKTGYTYDPDTDTFTDEAGVVEAGWAVRRDWRSHQQWMKERGLEPAAELTAMIRRGEGMDNDAQEEIPNPRDYARQPIVHPDKREWEQERVKMTEELRRVKDENLYLRGQVDSLKWYIKETL